MIDDVLELARLESSEVSVASEPIDVVQVIHELEVSLAPMAAEQNVAIELERAIEGLPNAIGDRPRLVQALFHLGTNGIKYNRPGGRVELGAAVCRPGWLRIAVRDTGIGIPVAKQPLIFQPFQRAGQEVGPIKAPASVS